MNDPHDVVVAADVYTLVSEEAVEAVPWIYLVCQHEECPWFLGFAPKATISELSSAAARHEIEGEAWLQRRQALGENH